MNPLQSSVEPEKGAGLAMGLAYAGGEGVTVVFAEVITGGLEVNVRRRASQRGFGDDVIYYVRRRVFEGDSVTLDSTLTEMKDNDVIRWRFGDTLIAEKNKRVDRFTVNDDVLGGRFRDRLKLDNQTGSLTITNTTMKHAGDYDLQLNNKRAHIFLVVTVSVTEGDSVTINSRLTEIKDVVLIRWRFGNALIAEIDKRVDRFTVNNHVLGGRFRDRLKLDKQTESLTITNITMKHAGEYQLEINYKTVAFYLAVIVSVTEGDSVTLDSGLTGIKDDYPIHWKFKNTFLAEINKRVDRIAVYDDVLDGRFRDRLKLDNQTGSLTITNITMKHAGEYVLDTHTFNWPSYIHLIVYGELNISFTCFIYYS
ncbi:contactin-4-like [Chanodichthys erythropterus]|uniref:contactin-4-like n=1 Tax=Chanodichthys erythropterus TaxID=933992 RepID=UPI00351EB6C4